MWSVKGTNVEHTVPSVMTVVPIGMTSKYTMIFGIVIDEIVCF